LLATSLKKGHVGSATPAIGMLPSAKVRTVLGNHSTGASAASPPQRQRLTSAVSVPNIA
jgi:hypothetical protein